MNSQSQVPVRAMLDSNGFDHFLVIDDAIDVLNDLTRRGRLVIVTTHVQRDELGKTPERRRAQLLAVYDRLVMTEVPTAGAIWNVSKWGQAKWGDGSGGTGTLRIGDLITAGAEVDILVTDERTLPNRFKRKTDRPEALTFAQFL